ncbi:MAG: DUF6517 family protein [Haloarculaceae archaeon]
MGGDAWGRGVATSVCILVVVVSAGCGALSGSGSLTFTASNATVDSRALSETNYSLQRAENTTIDRSIEVGGETKSLTITNHVATYGAEYRGAPLAHAVLLSTPRAGAFGQGLNPLGQAARRDLVERASDRAGDLAVDRRVDNRTIRTLGQEVTVTRYAATASGNGSGSGGSAEVYVLLMRATHDGDYVIAAITYPRELDAGLEDALTLLRNIEH